jgi:hypothetical protein
MKAQVMGSISEELKIQVRIPVGNTMYEGEQVIQEAILFLHFFRSHPYCQRSLVRL